MSLQFDLKELIGTDYDGADLTDRIIERTAAHLAGQMSDEVKSVVRATAAEMVKTKIRDAIDGIFDTPFLETDNYGTTRNGAVAKTPLEMILDNSNAYLTARVSTTGNPAGYGDNGMSRLEWLSFGKHAEEFLKESIAPEMRKLADEFKKTIGGKLSIIFRDALTQAMK